MRRFLQGTVLTLLLACAVGASAQNFPRAQKWEFTLQPQYTTSQSFSGSDGSSAKLDSALGFGLGFAYNLNNHFSVGGEFVWSQGDYTATYADANTPSTTATSKGTMWSNTLRMNATWNILASDITPFVSGGLGSTYVNSNIPNGFPSNTCYWDPWYGYICGTYTPTKSATELSWMAAAGMRWDVSRDFFMRALVLRLWIDANGATPSFDQYRIDFGFKF